MGLPGEEALTLTGESIAISKQASDGYSVAAQAVSPTESRALIHIDGKNSPERYDFSFEEAGSLVVLPDGGVNVLDEDANLITSIAPPWAVDGDGTQVPTHCEISGTTLTQVVEHQGGDYEYGIVADPSLMDHIKKVVGGCLGIGVGGATSWAAIGEGVLAKFYQWDTAIKFVVRRIGVVGAVSCMGGIVWNYI